MGVAANDVLGWPTCSQARHPLPGVAITDHSLQIARFLGYSVVDESDVDCAHAAAWPSMARSRLNWRFFHSCGQISTFQQRTVQMAPATVA